MLIGSKWTWDEHSLGFIGGIVAQYLRYHTINHSKFDQESQKLSEKMNSVETAEYLAIGEFDLKLSCKRQFDFVTTKKCYCKKKIPLFNETQKILTKNTRNIFFNILVSTTSYYEYYFSTSPQARSSIKTMRINCMIRLLHRLIVNDH